MYGNCLGNFSSEYGLFISLFLGGFVGSLTHCTGMCGPLVLGQIGALSQKSPPYTKMLLPYHLGRITTYVLMAVSLSSVVGFTAFFGFPKSVLSVLFLSLAALLFMVSAVPGLSRMFPWLARVSLPLPTGFIARIARPLMINPAGWRGYGLGLLLGFMPCGLVIAALMATATADNLLMAGFAMALFGLGTMPVLMSIGHGGSWIKRNWPVQTQAISSIIMAVNGLLLFWLAANVAI